MQRPIPGEIVRVDAIDAAMLFSDQIATSDCAPDRALVDTQRLRCLTRGE